MKCWQRQYCPVSHQDLSKSGLDMEIVYAEGKGLGDPVKSLIAAGRYSVLDKIIHQQNHES